MGRPQPPSRSSSLTETPSPAARDAAAAAALPGGVGGVGLTSYASVENLMTNLTMHAESILMPPPPPPPASGPRQENGDSAAQRHVELMPPPGAVPPPPPPRSSSLFTSALMETSFGVDSNEPRTRIYANLPNPTVKPTAEESYEPHSTVRPLSHTLPAPRVHQQQLSGAADVKSSHKLNAFASTMSMYQTWREDEAVFDAESKCYSMSDVHNIAPCPENELSRRCVAQTPAAAPASWGSAHSVATKESDTDSCQYGYTVVVSRTPKDEDAPQRKRSLPTDDYITADHCYSSLSKHRECVSTSDLHRGPPPPYKPPPKYERHAKKGETEYGRSLAQSSKYSRTSASSVSSYESARSHLSPVSPPVVVGDLQPARDNPREASPAAARELRAARGDGAALRSQPQSRVSLTESYQLAIDGSCTTPTGKSLFASSIRRAFSSPSEFSTLSVVV